MLLSMLILLLLHLLLLPGTAPDKLVQVPIGHVFKDKVDRSVRVPDDLTNLNNVRVVGQFPQRCHLPEVDGVRPRWVPLPQLFDGNHVPVGTMTCLDDRPERAVA